jgi:hypothetical protein
MSTVRDAVRAKILGEKPGHSAVELDDGSVIEVRQLTVGQMLDTVNETDIKKRMARYLIECCFVPDSEDRVFEEADFDVLMTLPSGGSYQKLMDAINKMLLPVQVGEAKKD